ncbi:hypothetical protein BDR07DRAFT_1371698 [Suillus spraguei]|nr:hypothetical protein BDR07DRAFT_1371698 [Suillus spraguei]
MHAEEEMEALAKRRWTEHLNPGLVRHHSHHLPLLLRSFPSSLRMVTRWNSFSPGMKLSPSYPWLPITEGEVSESLKASTPLSSILSDSGTTKGFVAPVPAAPIHTLRIVKQPQAHIRTTSMSSAGSSSTGSSAEKVVAPTVPRSAIHKPILTDVRCPPSELMPATLEANIFCMLEQGV